MAAAEQEQVLHHKHQQQYNHNRLKLYTPEEIDHYERSKKIAKYVNAGLTRAKNNGTTYKQRLQRFSQYVYQKMNKKEIDDLVIDLQNSKPSRLRR